MPLQFSWLLLEGLLPLAGAGVIYLLWGVFRYVAAVDKSFKYHWSEAADPLGWLYGAVIIAAQSAMKCFSEHGVHQTLAWMCVLGGLACLLLLVAAMTDRAATAAWKPPISLQVFAVVLVGGILYVGLKVHTPLEGTTP